jgi:hypothetical protein
MRVLIMSTGQRGRGSKYTDDFKRMLVAQSSADGVSVPMVAQRHGIPENRIYAWRGDPRFQPDDTDAPAFTPVEIADADGLDGSCTIGVVLRHTAVVRNCLVEEPPNASYNSRSRFGQEPFQVHGITDDGEVSIALYGVRNC